MKIKRCVVILLMVCLIIFLLPIETLATGATSGAITGATSALEELEDTSSTDRDPNNKNGGSKQVSDDLTSVITGMSGVKNGDASTNIGKVINTVIRIIQVAGSGIAVIMVTMLGIKYMIASSNEKAEVKKQAMPIVVGCVLLFAAVNIVAIIASVGDKLN